jgi:hypothetical protein
MNHLSAARLSFGTIALFATIAVSAVASAQAPAAAPAGTMGLCKDGTYSANKTKSGACAGHKGVKTWYGADATAKSPKMSPATATPAPVAPKPATVTPPPAPTATAMPAPMAPSTRKSTAMPTTAAAGGGPGLVWVNTGTKVYHCLGSKYYGKTKAGKYMPEADAKAAGDHADHGKACT